jgi:PKHD-type hydroxylase
MSVYNFVPSPDLSTREQNFAFWDDAFSAAELSDIRKIGDALPKEKATVNTTLDQIPEIRTSDISWIAYNRDTAFIYDKMAYVARMLNGQFFDFDISGFVEDFQYTVYNSECQDKYDWHMDKGNINAAPRKLSLVLQLSDPDEYEGGDLEFFMGVEGIKAKKQLGTIYAFPSYIVHRVTPVTRGTRKSLVSWICGPKFR